MIQVLEMNASLIKIKYMAQKILQLIGDPNKSKQYKRKNISFLFPVHIGLHFFFYSYKWTFLNFQSGQMLYISLTIFYSALIFKAHLPFWKLN